MGRSRNILFIFSLSPIILLPLWAYLNGTALMLLGIATWYVGGLLFFNDYGFIILLGGVFTFLYFILLDNPFSIHDPMFSIFISMVLGYLTAVVYGNVKKAELKRKRDIEGGFL